MKGLSLRSALYDGRVWHRRLRPREHELAYAIPMMLVDLDDLTGLAGLRLFSVNRFNLMDLRSSDHLDGLQKDLKVTVSRILAEAGLATGGRVRLLCMPRVLGAVFNPLSVYFCETPQGALQAILYEVNNTFGERHSYLMGAAPAQSGLIQHSCRKAFFVSPFNTLEMTYDFSVTPPGDLADDHPMAVKIEVRDKLGLLMIAAFTGTRQPLTDAAIVRTWLRHPLPALKVLAAIHWEALKLWLKGVGLQRRPAPPVHQVSVELTSVSEGASSAPTESTRI